MMEIACITLNLNTNDYISNWIIKIVFKAKFLLNEDTLTYLNTLILHLFFFCWDFFKKIMIMKYLSLNPFKLTFLLLFFNNISFLTAQTLGKNYNFFQNKNKLENITYNFSF